MRQKPVAELTPEGRDGFRSLDLIQSSTSLQPDPSAH